ncbi:MAG: DMT family transporter, partial [Frankia sp.]
FALPLGARHSGRRMRRSELAWAGVLTAGLAVFVIAGNPARGIARTSFAAWLPLLIAVGVVVSGCFAMSRLGRGTVRAVLLAVAAGVLFGVAAALTKSAVDLLGRGFVPFATGWEVYALAVVSLTGTVLQQAAYHVGDLRASLPTTTVLEPVVAGVIGVTLLREEIRADGAEWALIALAVCAMTVATTVLARDSSRDVAGAAADNAAGDGDGDGDAADDAAGEQRSDGDSPAITPT